MTIRRSGAARFAAVFSAFGLVVLGAPAADATCKPICQMSGGLQGTNITVPRYATAFSWNLRWQGATAERGSTTPIDTRTTTSGGARFDGAITSVNGELVQGSGTLTIAHPTRETAFAAIPMQLSARASGGTADAGMVREAALETLGLGAGAGASAAIVDGALTGTVTAGAVFSDEEDPMLVTLSSQSTFAGQSQIPFSGSATTQYGHPLAATQVQLLVDGDVATTVTTGRDGTFTGFIPPLTPTPHTLQARVLSGTPLESHSPPRSITPTFTVTTVASGPGTIQSELGACAATCQSTVLYGTTITFAANPGPYARLQSWSGGCTGTGPCQVTVTAPTTIGATFALWNADLVESEPNDTISTATPTSIPVRIAGGLPSSDIDWFSFTTTSNSLVTLATFDDSLSTCVQIDTVVTLAKSDGSTIATDDDGGPAYCSLLTKAIPAGSYRVRLNAYGTSAAPEYRLHITTRPSPPFEVEPNDTSEAAQTVAIPGAILGAISPATDIDRFRFTTTIAGMHRFETADEGGTACQGFDTTLTLSSAGEYYGYPVAFDDDGGTDLCSMISVWLYPGTYTLDVASYNNETVIAGYRLTLAPA